MNILRYLIDNPTFTLIASVTIIQIVPIQINPWSWLGSLIRNVLLGSLDSKIDGLKDDITDLRNEVRQNEAVQSRTRIQMFGDEILHGKVHTKEHYESIIHDVENYEKYCNKHPNFLNSVTEMTAKRIIESYQIRLENNDFL